MEPLDDLTLKIGIYLIILDLALVAILFGQSIIYYHRQTQKLGRELGIGQKLKEHVKKVETKTKQIKAANKTLTQPEKLPEKPIEEPARKPEPKVRITVGRGAR